MKKAMLFMVLVMAVCSWGAMTRDKVCIEQNGWHHASVAGHRGFNVWLPYGSECDEWLCWQTTQEQSSYVDGYVVFGAFTAKIKAGHYMALNKAITNGSSGPTWYPSVAGGGAGVDVTESAGWAVQESASNLYWSSLYPGSDGRYLDVNVPAGTDRLYMLARPYGDNNFGFSISKQSGTGTVEDATVITNNSGDYAQFGEEVYYNYPAYTSSTYEGYPHYRAALLIASNCDGVIRVTGNVNTSYPRCVGFIAIDDDSTAQPDTGVIDPTTIEYVMPISFNNSGTQVSYVQTGEGPLYLKIGAGDPFFWGRVHWGGQNGSNAANVLGDPSSYVCYDDTEYGHVTGGSYNWPTDDAWVRHSANSVTITTTGNIDLHDGSTAAADVGTYKVVHQFTSSGLAISQKFTFNSNAVSSGVKLSVASGDGGYVAQWSMDNEFDKYLQLPYNADLQNIGSYDDSYAFEKNGTIVAMLDTTNDITALFTCGFSYTTGVTGYSKPLLRLLKNSTGDNYSKVYLAPIEGDTDITFSDGDEILAYQTRIITGTGDMEGFEKDIPTRRPETLGAQKYRQK